MQRTTLATAATAERLTAARDARHAKRAEASALPRRKGVEVLRLWLGAKEDVRPPPPMRRVGCHARSEGDARERSEATERWGREIL